MSKIVFTMLPHGERPKHSTRFNFERLEEDETSLDGVSKGDLLGFRPSFYIPRPVFRDALRVRVTIEELP
jgi:hypothetical protein